ncbi:hypothetical protein J2T60_001160 [Natronospira proteinivora]|uniref:Uncharacterized protein n=1 Tax=Natronospira proteinivora TaxID=1807133 RepID=A0ABT1G8F6_9GAMM|nr:hypothetical protein [Natronospira proteinivora]MCP1727195.1 hypothetical protein [Natronospira proteinivora]
MQTSQITEKNITGFDDMIAIAASEPQPHKLLTVLLRVDSPYRQDADGKTRPIENEGELVPIAIKAHDVDEDLDFATLKADADAGAPGWGLMMTAVLPGQGPQPPSEEDVDNHLKRMAQTVMSGGDMSRFLFVDRKGEAVMMESHHG